MVALIHVQARVSYTTIILYVPVGVVETASAAHYLLEIKGSIHGEKQLSFFKKRRRDNHGQKS
jgi:hypothetical protein